MSPVSSSTGCVDVLDSGYKILVHPWVVRVTNSMLLANPAHSWGNEGVPGTAHAREQVVLDLEVESTREASGNEPTVRRRGFDLCLEPTRSFVLSMSRIISRIAVYVLKVVRERKQSCKSETRRDAHYEDVGENLRLKSLSDKWRNTISVDVKHAQTNSELSALSDVRVIEIDSNLGGPTLFQRENFHVENRR